jgi:hypothetical protein
VTPRHYHGRAFMDFVVQGSSNIGCGWCKAGTMRWYDAKVIYGPVVAGPDGCILLEFSTDQPGFEVTVDEDVLNDDMQAELALVRADAGVSP